MMPTNTGLCKLSNIKYVWLEIKDKASTGWLCVKLKAGRSTTMDAQLREIGRKDGEAEVSPADMPAGTRLVSRLGDHA